MKKYMLLLIIPFLSFGQACQYGNSIDASELCDFYKGSNFATYRNADIALDKILDVTGMSKRFVLKECNDIFNCLATSYKGIRYILYDRDFMDAIATNTNSWSNLSILAHEIGHHVNGHSLDLIVYVSGEADAPTLAESRQMELEADEYSGFVMYKLGASLSDAQKAIHLVSTNEDDSYSTHPSKDKRLKAIEKGYNKAKDQGSNNDYSSSESNNDFIEVVTDLKYRYIKKGTGKKVYNKMINFHYIGKLPNGTIFDDSYSRDAPLIVELGAGQIISGLEQVMQLLSVGDIVKIIIPPKYHNLSKGVGEIIPPSSILIFEVEINSVE